MIVAAGFIYLSFAYVLKYFPGSRLTLNVLSAPSTSIARETVDLGVQMPNVDACLLPPLSNPGVSTPNAMVNFAYYLYGNMHSSPKHVIIVNCYHAIGVHSGHVGKVQKYHD